jgi:hypothetical protein
LTSQGGLGASGAHLQIGLYKPLIGIDELDREQGWGG